MPPTLDRIERTTPATPLRTLLRREESYAIHALIDVGSHPGTNAAAVAQRLSMPKAFMAKVLRTLVEAGWIESRMGRSGGVWLTADPSTVTLLDVMEATSGPVLLDTCQAEARCATKRRTGTCRLNRAYQTADRAVREALRSVRLADLIDDDVTSEEAGAPS